MENQIEFNIQEDLSINANYDFIYSNSQESEYINPTGNIQSASSDMSDIERSGLSIKEEELESMIDDMIA
jgi:hypothetical protein